jgi:hypothetical protein
MVTNLPTLDKLTDDERAAVARIVLQADGLAEAIFANEVPDIAEYRALHSLVGWARGSGLFSPSARHLDALQRLPADVALKLWADQEARLASVRGG